MYKGYGQQKWATEANKNCNSVETLKSSDSDVYQSDKYIQEELQMSASAGRKFLKNF